MENSAIEVVVTEGRVQVGAEGGQSRLLKSSAADLAGDDRPPSHWLVSAGERVVVPTAAHLPPPVVEKMAGAAAVPLALTEPSPRLVFAKTPLVDVVRQFNQLNRVQLELGDAELAARPVGGSFQADNVETFVRLLEGSGDIIAERPSPNRIVLHRAR
jgi:ferric-dicitrate binding protein FerR (iron transport regulator)